MKCKISAIFPVYAILTIAIALSLFGCNRQYFILAGSQNTQQQLNQAETTIIKANATVETTEPHDNENVEITVADKIHTGYESQAESQLYENVNEPNKTDAGQEYSSGFQFIANDDDLDITVAEQEPPANMQSDPPTEQPLTVQPGKPAEQPVTIRPDKPIKPPIPPITCEIPGLTYIQPLNGICIRGYFTQDMENPFYYVPDEQTVSELISMVSNLKPVELTPMWWKDMKCEPMMGYDLVCGDVWWVIWSNGIVVEYGSEKPGCVVAPELTEKVQALARDKLGTTPFDPHIIKNVASARMDFQYYNDDVKHTQTITDTAILADMESIMSNAGNVNGLTACPFNEAFLTLTLANGEEILLAIASDSCPVYVVNGQEFDYRTATYRGKEDSGWNNILYEYFDQIPLGRRGE